MTNDKGPATAGAPTPDEVENALARLESYSNGLGDGCCSTIRAHIAALEAENKRLAAELDFTAHRMKHEADERDKADDQNKRLREALENIANNKFLSYENTEASMYGTGVTDGHRLAAQWARDALAQTGDK